LLEFWGWWCGPCLDRGIPELRALHEEFRGQGLAIVGIHVDLESNEVGSVRELDQKLAEVRRTGWKGNDIPFAVALTAGNETPHASDVTRKARNKLCAEYGVVGYPTTVLIDRKGNVVGRFHPALEQDRARLKKLLGSP
jgi:thiol-disulfide isomerase/thioredoxin